MQIYTVGGAVRDELLGLPVQDRDYVVVGSSPEEMVRLGFRPVGKDFPVFLHPDSHEEYALARTERKTARGYKGFSVYATPEVTLEQDLARRDLTINAIAEDQQGRIIDPFGGVRDLQAKLLRHVSPAFAEDPVRVLRVARFAARFGFDIADETLALMQAMADNGEVDALVPERVWQELAKGLMESTPARMFQALRACGALARILPEVDALFGVPQPAEYHPEIDTGVHTLLVLDYAASQGYSLPVRFAALAHDLGKGTTPSEEWPHHHGHEERGVELTRGLCRRIKTPNDCRDLALLATRLHGKIHRALELRPETVLKLLGEADALRKPQRFAELLQVCASDSRGRTGWRNKLYPQTEFLHNALNVAMSIDAGAVASQCVSPEGVGEAVRRQRLAAISAWMDRKA